MVSQSGERTVVRMSATVLLGERSVTSKKRLRGRLKERRILLYLPNVPCAYFGVIVSRGCFGFSLLSLTILIDFFFSNHCVFDSFCFKRYLVSDFIASNYESRVLIDPC